METKYFIKDGIIYFDCDFNEPLDDYIDIMKNCTQIIFSNYDDYVICIETKNKYIMKYGKKYKNNNFNQPLQNSLDHQIQLSQLIFGYSFNQPLANSLDHQT